MTATTSISSAAILPRISSSVMPAPFVDDVVVENALSGDCEQAPTSYLIPRGRGVYRMALTQPPGYRTGADIAPAGPTPAERAALYALGNSRIDLTRQLARKGNRKATVSTPKPAKVQAKKIRQVLEHRAGIV